MDKFNSVLSKIVSREEVVSLVQKWKQEGERVVFSNGCFDIVHRGHIEYLAKAASKGDRLVLGLNTDASVRRLKGDDRPVVSEDARAILLAALEFIDLVVLFDEETPYDLIKLVVPDILVKGSDYAPEDIVGYDVVMENGGSVETVDLVEGYSTTSLIERISKAYTSK